MRERETLERICDNTGKRMNTVMEKSLEPIEGMSIEKIIGSKKGKEGATYAETI